MALLEVPSYLFTAIFQTENKGSKLMVHIKHGEKQTYVYHKTLCLGLCYLTFMLFNIYITDLFHLMIGTKICNFAGDNTLYSCDHEVKTVITKPFYNMVLRRPYKIE